jgi:succinyl-diaminopimelate desuccinylase
VVAEPTSYNNCEVGQKGSLQVRIQATGRSAHGSIGNYAGDNAIKKLVAILGRVEELREMTGRFLPSQAEVLRNSKRIAEEALKVPGVGNVIDHVTVNLGTIKGGTKTTWWRRCEAEVDFRLPSGHRRQVLDRLDAS